MLRSRSSSVRLVRCNLRRFLLAWFNVTETILSCENPGLSTKIKHMRRRESHSTSTCVDSCCDVGTRVSNWLGMERNMISEAVGNWDVLTQTLH